MNQFAILHENTSWTRENQRNQINYRISAVQKI